MSTFDALVADLSRDAQRVQPKDALQWCANWFQSRLEEQRTRTRDAIAHRPSIAAALPTDHWADQAPLTASPVPPSATSAFTDPFEARRTSSFVQPRTASPFGSLSVSNGLYSSDGIPDPTTTGAPPSFRFDGDASSQPNALDSYTMFDSATPSQSPSPGDFLNTAFSNHILERRTSVSAEPISVDSESHEPLPIYHKSKLQIQRITTTVKDNLLFKNLDEEQKLSVINAMEEKQIEANRVIIKQGDMGDFFYVVDTGAFKIYKKDNMPPDAFRTHPPFTNEELMSFSNGGLGTLVETCGPGSSFGELALMYGHPRAATVVADEPSTVWALDRLTFRTIILKAAHRRRTMYEQFLSTVSLLSSLSTTERSKISDALESKVYEDGEAVVRQGDMGDTFFFVEEGEASVTKTVEGEDGTVVEDLVGHLIKGDYFGELALLRRAPRAATVSAVRRNGTTLPKLKVAALSAGAFTRLLGPLREIMERNASTYASPSTTFSH